MILDENPNFPPKFVKNLHIQNFNKKKKKMKVQFFFPFSFYLTCFMTVPIFKSIGPLVAEIWGGGGGPKQPLPPMDSSPQNNPMGLGLIVSTIFALQISKIICSSIKYQYNL